MDDGRAATLRAYIAERDIAWVRVAVIAFNIILYFGWLPHDPQRHTLALVISVIAAAYAVLVVALRPYEHLPVLGTSAYTLTTDSGLIAVWLYATGGVASPFYALWLLSLMAVVFRFGSRAVLAAAVIYAAADTAMLAVAGDLAGDLPAAASRVVYILLVGTVGVLLGHRWSGALRDRIRMEHEVARQESALHDAERLRVLTEAALEGILIHRDGTILEVNPAACRILDTERGDLIGRNAAVFFPAEAAREWGPGRSDDPVEMWFTRGGQRRRLVLQGRELKYQGEATRIVALRDITQEYEARRAREQAAAREAEIARLQEVDRFKTRFINTAAHELNTPLTPLKLQLHLLRGSPGLAPRGLDILERNLDRLSRLVADMLDVARMQSGRLRYDCRPVDLAPVFDEVVETFRATAEAQDVSLEQVVPPRLIAFADPERVVQVLTNLLSNALKFTPPGGRVTLTARQGADGAVVEVIDTGRGLSGDDRQKLFQPFGQIHDEPGIPGTGLGLYICRNLAEGMGGRIGATSDGPGHGSRFWLELPRDAPGAQSGGADQDAGRSGGVPRKEDVMRPVTPSEHANGPASASDARPPAGAPM